MAIKLGNHFEAINEASKVDQSIASVDAIDTLTELGDWDVPYCIRSNNSPKFMPTSFDAVWKMRASTRSLSNVKLRGARAVRERFKRRLTLLIDSDRRV